MDELTQQLELLPRLLQDMQSSSVATQRKSINKLHPLFLRAAALVEEDHVTGSLKLVGERAFGRAFKDAVARILAVKKGLDVGEKSVKFIAAFVKFCVDYGTSSRVHDDPRLLVQNRRKPTRKTRTRRRPPRDS